VVLGVNLILLLILALTGNEEAGSSHRSFAHHPWGSPLGKWLQLILAFLYLIYPAGFLSSAVIVPLAMLLLVIMITLGFKAYR
jgi:hypothetical protein